jgi:hypothetical protein
MCRFAKYLIGSPQNRQLAASAATVLVFDRLAMLVRNECRTESDPSRQRRRMTTGGSVAKQCF